MTQRMIALANKNLFKANANQAELQELANALNLENPSHAQIASEMNNRMRNSKTDSQLIENCSDLELIVFYS